MARCGGHSYAPRRCGGGKPVSESILESIEQQMGTAYTRDPDSVFHARNIAIARMIAVAWTAGNRARKLRDAERSSERERVLAINGDPDVATSLARSSREYDPVSAFDIDDAARSAFGSALVGIRQVPSGSWVVTADTSQAAIVLARVSVTGTVEELLQQAATFLALATTELPSWSVADWYVASPSAPVDDWSFGIYHDEDYAHDMQVFD